MEILIIAIVAFLAALLTFFSGFGLGTILTPVMLIFFPPEIAISLTGIVHFSNNIFKLSIIGKQFNKEVLIKFGIPAVLFAFVGSYALFFISNDSLFTYNLLGNNMNVSYLQFIIAIILIAFALIDLMPFFKKLKFNKSILPVGGILSGFFGGLTGNQGALRSAFLIKMDLDKTVFIATTVVISFFVDITRIGVYISNIKDFEISNYVVLGLAATLSAIIGSYIGFKSLKKITLNYIRNLVAVMILLIAFLLLLGVL
tara:strand:+ start:58 stop:828 length:771 start_codon:yes stop_codon:yes gene_type:complete